MQTQHDADKQKANNVDSLQREKDQAMWTIERLEKELASVESRMSRGSATGHDVAG